MQLRDGMEVMCKGLKCRVIGQPDSDPRCAVWLCVVADPDRAIWAMRSEITLCD